MNKNSSQERSSGMMLSQCAFSPPSPFPRMNLTVATHVAIILWFRLHFTYFNWFSIRGRAEIVRCAASTDDEGGKSKGEAKCNFQLSELSWNLLAIIFLLSRLLCAVTQRRQFHLLSLKFESSHQKGEKQQIEWNPPLEEDKERNVLCLVWRCKANDIEGGLDGWETEGGLCSGQVSAESSFLLVFVKQRRSNQVSGKVYW